MAAADGPDTSPGRIRVHLDTDLGTNVDDLAALVLLLGSPGVELTGVTTCVDPGGRRAGYVRHALALAGRHDVAVAAGSELSSTTLAVPGTIPDDRRWGEPVAPAPSPAGSALGLLAGSVAAGATIVAIGPYTNLGLLAVERPDVLARANVVVMGGWFDPAPEGLGSWSPARDWNVQSDTTAASMVIARSGRLAMVPLSLTVRTWLRGGQLGRLRAAGRLGRLIARQAEVQAAERSMAALARAHPALPPDLLAFHHDPLTCAAALGWPGVTWEERRLATVGHGDVVHVVEAGGGRLARVAVDVDAAAFDDLWLASVEALAPPAPAE